VNSPKTRNAKILAGFTDFNVLPILQGYADAVEVKVLLGDVGLEEIAD
jgi:hypothetical protein